MNIIQTTIANLCRILLLFTQTPSHIFQSKTIKSQTENISLMKACII